MSPYKDPERGRANKRAYYLAHRDEHLARAEAWRLANPEKRRTIVRDWNRRNPERVEAAQRAWRIAHPERTRAWAKAWRLANPERHRQMEARRRARKAAVGIARITKKDLDRLVARHRGACAYCGASWEHLDHVVPLARGGPHSIGNLVPACAPCNLSKNSALVVEWKFRDRIAA